ncbi:MAG TPA: YHS domain-containing (seleno)protein [Verrucomicrobiae bacterium]|jgi:YHS domain-containing protein
MRSNFFRTLIGVALLTASAALCNRADAKDLQNLDRKGIAAQGYDVVAFFTDGKPMKGSAAFSSANKGATYHFASAAHKAAFDADPVKYEPQFGGYCAYGVSRGKLVEIDVEAFQIVNGKLLLQYSKGVRNDFNKDTVGNLKKAEGNWPGLVEKKGK